MKAYKEQVVKVFDEVASDSARGGLCSAFSDLGRRLVEHLSPKPGQAILDVATGDGAVLFPAAESVGPHGKVIGVDLSFKMLEEARKKLQKKQLHWVDLQQLSSDDLATLRQRVLKKGKALMTTQGIPLEFCNSLFKSNFEHVLYLRRLEIGKSQCPSQQYVQPLHHLYLALEKLILQVFYRPFALYFSVLS